jgi:hypothetical protein
MHVGVARAWRGCYNSAQGTRLAVGALQMHAQQEALHGAQRVGGGGARGARDAHAQRVAIRVADARRDGAVLLAQVVLRKQRRGVAHRQRGGGRTQVRAAGGGPAGAGARLCQRRASAVVAAAEAAARAAAAAAARRGVARGRRRAGARRPARGRHVRRLRMRRRQQQRPATQLLLRLARPAARRHERRERAHALRQRGQQLALRLHLRPQLTQRGCKQRLVRHGGEAAQKGLVATQQQGVVTRPAARARATGRARQGARRGGAGACVRAARGRAARPLHALRSAERGASLCFFAICRPRYKNAARRGRAGEGKQTVFWAPPRRRRTPKGDVRVGGGAGVWLEEEEDSARSSERHVHAGACERGTRVAPRTAARLVARRCCQAAVRCRWVMAGAV